MNEKELLEKIEGEHDSSLAFANYLDEWLRVTNSRFLWQVADYIDLDPTQQVWLRECIYKTHGQEMGLFVTQAICAFHLDSACSYDDIKILDAITHLVCNDAEMENFRGICKAFKLQLTDKQRHYINEYENLNKTFPNMELLLIWVKNLRPVHDRHQFMGCLPDLDKDLTLSYFLEFIETIPSLDPQQVQWVKECVPKNGYVLQDTTGPLSYGQTIVTQPVLQSVAPPQLPDNAVDKQTAVIPEMAVPYDDEQTAAAPTTKRKTKDPLEVFPKKVRKQARQYFDKAIKIGLMDKKYHWLETKVLLACFAFGVSRALELNGTIKVRDRDEYKYISWIPFEKIFGVKGKPLNLRGSLNDCIKKEKDPKHYNLILEIFPNLNILAD